MKRWLASAALVCASFLVAGLFAEVVVRLVSKDDIPLFPRYHTDYQYARYTLRGLRANSEFWHTSVDGHWRFVTNSRGFRDTREFAYAKPVNTLRVLVLGDSNTQGYEVNQDSTFSAVLERYLKQRQINAEVINTGVSGFSTAEELALLENEGVKYHPDVVVVGLFENDFDDNFKAELFALDGKGELTAQKFAHIPGVRIQNVIYAVPGVRWLSEHSYFYSLLFNTAWNVGKLIMMRTASHASHAGVAPPSDFEFAKATQDNVTPAQLALMRALLERMQRFCQQHSIRLIVADVPGYPSRWHMRPSIPVGLRDSLTHAGIEVLDSRKVFDALDGAAALHVEHGYNHISTLAHAMLGVGLGRLLAPPVATP